MEEFLIEKNRRRENISQRVCLQRPRAVHLLKNPTTHKPRLPLLDVRHGKAKAVAHLPRLAELISTAERQDDVADDVSCECTQHHDGNPFATIHAANARTERCGRPRASTFATDAARPHSLQ